MSIWSLCIDEARHQASQKRDPKSHLNTVIFCGVCRLSSVVCRYVLGLAGACRRHVVSGTRFAAKLFWAFWRFVVPYKFFEGVSSPLVFLALFIVSEFTTGYYLAFNFQVMLAFELDWRFDIVPAAFWWLPNGDFRDDRGEGLSMSPDSSSDEIVNVLVLAARYFECI